MHILLTRPLEDCSQMILRFQSLGNKVSHLPLLKVKKIDYNEINFSEFKGIVFTSANAVKFLDHKIIDKKNGKIIYVSGENISIDLDQELIKEGYDVRRIINYRTIHNENFNELFIKELKLNMPDIVYVYSQNSASSLLKFIKLCKSESLWMNTNLMCLGEKTSAILNEIKWKKIFLFNPGEEEFLLYKI